MRFLVLVLALALACLAQQPNQVQQTVNALVAQQTNVINVLMQLPAVVAQRDSLQGVVNVKDKRIADLEAAQKKVEKK